MAMRDYEELVSVLRYEADGFLMADVPDMLMVDTLNDAADAIDELCKQLASCSKSVASCSKWTSVEERLPELYDNVLVYYERNAWPDGADSPIRKREIGVGFCGWPDRWHVDGCSKVKGIAWMPLPEPPLKEEKNEVV